jgi:glutathione synthase/RimK-type ligase-like ATP-grasp enzyme
VSESDDHVRRALQSRGVAVEARAWNDPAASFGGFGVVLLRSNWDYHLDPDAFLAWLDRLDAAGLTVWNQPALVRWNLSKRYLLDLAAAGVPVVPTALLDGNPDALAALLVERGWTTAVVKPAVSASAHGAVLVPLADAPRVAAAIASGEIRSPVLVQPFVEEIRTRGEWSLVFIDGRFTHGIVKHPAPHDFRGRRAPAPRAGGEAAVRVLAAFPCPRSTRVSTVSSTPAASG